jgi:hypothetical protein
VNFWSALSYRARLVAKHHIDFPHPIRRGIEELSRSTIRRLRLLSVCGDDLNQTLVSQQVSKTTLGRIFETDRREDEARVGDAILLPVLDSVWSAGLEDALGPADVDDFIARRFPPVADEIRPIGTWIGFRKIAWRGAESGRRGRDSV